MLCCVIVNKEISVLTRIQLKKENGAREVKRLYQKYQRIVER